MSALYILGSLELSAVGDDDLLGGLAGLRANSLDGLDDIQALNNLAEDNVLAVQPGAGDSANEELGSVGVGASVSHGKDTSASVLVDEVLISELSTVDGLSTDTTSMSEVTTLEHELGDNSVEDGSLEVQGLAGLAHSLLASAESSEVLRSLGGIGSEGKSDATSWSSTD